LQKARIRGIYSTALTKLLLENGFEIVDPSQPIKERFGLKANVEAYDLKIEDREDKQGVQTTGKRESIELFQSILHLNFEDVITRKWPVSVNGIYKGLVKGFDNKGTVLVDIGHATGRLPKDQIENLEENSVLVQVERRALGKKYPLLTTKIKLPGPYAILIPTQKIGVSLKIRDPQKRFQLMKLGKEVAPKSLGIIWRSAAAEKDPAFLKNEVKELVKQREKILRKAETMEAPSLIWEGFYYMDVEFPALSKKRLDEIRADATPTVKGHHNYKACGGEISSALEMAEKLLEKGGSKEEVEDLLRKTIEKEYPCEGDIIEVHHVKLNGKVLNLGKALLESLEGRSICFRRVFNTFGLYDGLRIKKEAGDQAVTEAQLGEWFFKTSYFSKEGHYKGTYINFNTPIELYPYGIRYVDLEVDVCVWPNGTVKVVDEDKLEEALKRGIINKRLTSLVKRKVREVIKTVQQNRLE